MNKTLDQRNILFAKEILFKHDDIFNSKSRRASFMRSSFLQSPDIFDVPRLLEKTVAFVGGYNFIDAFGKDFDDFDNSDLKVATLVDQVEMNGSYVAYINNVSTKEGALRIIVANILLNRVDYFFIGKRDLKNLLKNKKDKTRFRIIYNVKKQVYTVSYTVINHFMVDNFENLCRKTTG